MIVDFNAVEIWWIILVVISVLNLTLWIRAVVFLAKDYEGMHYKGMPYRTLHAWLSGIYVAGCGFRSVLPRVDIQRMVLYDDWLSSILLGRSVATIAELCFAIQWALVVRVLCANSENLLLKNAGYILVGLILLAEIFSWYSVITTNFFGHVIEESLWALSTFITIGILFKVKNRFDTKIKKILSVLLVVSLGYFLFLVTTDIPMYLSRWQMDQLTGKSYLTFVEGLSDLNKRWIVNFNWRDWKDEAPWMTLYFSVGVWISIYFIHAPWFKSK